MPIATNPDTGETVFLSPEGQWQPAKTAVNPQTKETLAFDGSQWVPLKTAPPDQYKQAAIDEREKLKGMGMGGGGYAERMAHGMTFGGLDEIMAGATVPFEMIKRGTLSPAEAYRYTKAREDLRKEDMVKNQGTLGHVAEIAGSVGSGASLARNGFTLMRQGAGLARNLIPGLAEGAGYGAAGGFLGGGNSFEDRFNAAGKGALIGGGAGVALPVAGRIVGALAAPVVSNIRARFNPEGVAAAQAVRAAQESGRPIADIAADVRQAAAEGQPMFTAADAMGNPGQRMLYTTAASPGRGRTDVVNFLENRQEGQGRRIINTLSEGLDAPVTAQQATAARTAARDTAADAAYGQVRRDANPVDLTPAVRTIDQTLAPGSTQVARPNSGIANDSIEAALQRYRSMMTDGRSMLTDFTAVQRVRGELADAVQVATQRGQGNRARMLGQVLRQVDGAMERASAGHAAANRAYERSSRNIEAIAQGRNDAMRGRSEDVTRNFAARPPDNQAPYKVGYADRLIENAQVAPGVNKARPLLALGDELPTIAGPQRAPVMMNRVNRENTMFETRRTALGGSRTDENMADRAAQAVDPSVVMALLGGDIRGAIRHGYARASNALNGNTPQVREHLARILMQRGGNHTLEQELARELARNGRNSGVLSALMGGARGGVANAIPYERAR